MVILGGASVSALVRDTRNLGISFVTVALMALAGCQTPPLPADRVGYRSPQALDTKLGCNIALVVLKGWAADKPAKPEVLSEEPGDGSPWVVSDVQPQPPAALLDRYDAATPSSALHSCRGLAEQARALGYKSGRAAERWASRDSEGHLRRIYRATVVWIALPVISSDGAEALVSYGVRSARLGGGGGVVYLKRGIDGRWQTVNEVSLFLA